MITYGAELTSECAWHTLPLMVQMCQDPLKTWGQPGGFFHFVHVDPKMKKFGKHCSKEQDYE